MWIFSLLQESARQQYHRLVDSRLQISPAAESINIVEYEIINCSYRINKKRSP